jgi:hypothetical protein
MSSPGRHILASTGGTTYYGGHRNGISGGETGAMGDRSICTLLVLV